MQGEESIAEPHEQATIAFLESPPVTEVPSNLVDADMALGGLYGRVFGFAAGTLLSSALLLSLPLSLPSRALAAEAGSGASNVMISSIRDIGTLASLEAATESVREDYNGWVANGAASIVIKYDTPRTYMHQVCLYIR